MDLDHVGSTVYVLLLEQIMPKAAEDTPNPIKVRIPASNHPDGVLRLEIHNNDRLFIVGPNGSGKSALIQHFVSAIQNRKTRRISAHRQTWLASSAIGMTAQRRYDAETRITARERHKDARWKDELAAERLSAVLFDLVAAENERARNIAHLLDIDNLKEAKITAVDFPSPFRRINTLLVAGNLSVQIAATTGEQIFAHYLKGDPFSMAKLSDGERNAIILAATVLTVESGIVLLIDEPERHLHRSIIEPFLTALFASRTDCPFIISTHDLSLPIAAPDARVLLPRSCEWEGDVVKSFDIDLLEGRTDLPEYLKISILGSRKRMLFVEGEPRSLDAAIYGLLLPGVTVNAKGSSVKVIRAVDGLRSANDLHWLHAYGLVDRDDRSDEDIAKLQETGTFALTVHSTESIYYSAAAMGWLARRQAETFGSSAEGLLKAATEVALATLKDEETMLRLCARRCERLVRSKVLSQMPDWREIQAGADIAISAPVQESYHEEVAMYRVMIESGNLEGLISRYAVRESGALSAIATKFEFSSRPKYEQAVLALASSEADFRDELRALIGPLAAEIGVV